jgi:hypothetical protein
MIWQKEVIGTYMLFLEVARAISRIIFKNPRDFLEIRRLGLILNKYRGLFAKWQEFLGFGIIFQW